MKTMEQGTYCDRSGTFRRAVALLQWEVCSGGAYTEAVLFSKIAVHTSYVQFKLLHSLQSHYIAKEHRWEGTMLCV